MEDVGEQYFHELLSRSIFQQSCHEPSYFVMHDLLNDLAQHIAGEICFKFDGESSLKNPERVSHLSCIIRPSDTPDKFVAFYGKNKVLRTFLLLRSSGSKTHFDFQILKKLFPAPSCLRVLSLSSYNITEFPYSICDSKQLRYLDLSGAAIESLSELGKLCSLETLKLSGCSRLNQLPSNLSNLTKLEHLDISGTPNLKSLDSIGDLKQLGYLDLSRTQIQCLPKGVCSLYNLRVLKLSRCPRLTHLLKDMNNLTKLKHLDIETTPLENLPDSIGHLKELDYLDLSGTKIQCLPDGVCSLYNLKTLKLSNCHNLDCLPTDMKKLIKLENLDIKGTPIEQMPPKFGNLKRLQLLTNFVVGNSSVSSISEMKDLSLLRGTLSLLRLQNVSETIHAEIANLKVKKYLRELIFEWDVSAQDDLRATHASKILDKLHPGENLVTLEIRNFIGMTFSNWLGNASFSKMARLTLENCENCYSLPPLGQLPSLKELVILNLTKVNSVGVEFYGDGNVAFKSLETLQFKDMKNWETWLPFENEEVFPSLVNLYMIRCAKLTGDLPIRQHPSLQLCIEECDQLRSHGTSS